MPHQRWRAPRSRCRSGPTWRGGWRSGTRWRSWCGCRPCSAPRRRPGTARRGRGSRCSPTRRTRSMASSRRRLPPWRPCRRPPLPEAVPHWPPQGRPSLPPRRAAPPWPPTAARCSAVAASTSRTAVSATLPARTSRAAAPTTPRCASPRTRRRARARRCPRRPSPAPAAAAATLRRRATAFRGAPRNYGCGGFGRKQSCQCNDNCKDYGNCCSDYTDTCLDTDSPPPPTAPSATEGGGAQRGGKHSGWEAAGSSGDAGGDSLGCADYGCGEYNADQKCQCNPDCKTFDSCCSDYEVFCGGASVGPPQQAEDPAGFMGGAGGAGGDSCAKFGCVTYNAGHSCQCNAGCTEFGSCCSDYEEHCTAADGGHRSESASSDSGDGFFAAGGPPLSQ
ncbi:unnamed protein product, partial [Prorocentrum cordatum]